MSTKQSSKLIMLVIVLAVTISTFSPASYANTSDTVPVITDYNGNTFIRSDGSVWVLSGRQFIPTQVAGISNAVKVLEDGFVQTADGKTYALNVDKQIMKPFLVQTDSTVVKVRNQYIIDQEGKPYTYYFHGYQSFFETNKFNTFGIPFRIKDMQENTYSFDNLYLTVYLFLSTDGKIWIRDNVSRTVQEIGNKATKFSAIYHRVITDEDGTVWLLDINADGEIIYTLKPLYNDKKINKISNDNWELLAINEDNEGLVYFDSGWEYFRTVDILQPSEI